MKREHGKIFGDADSIGESATTSFPGSLSYLSRSVGTGRREPGVGKNANSRNSVYNDFHTNP